MNANSLLSAGKAGLVLATAMFSLTSCDPYYYGNGYGYGGGYYNGGGYYGGYGYPVGLSSYVPRYENSYNYSYYPRYGAYYHRPTQQYHYMHGGNWMSGPRLPGYSHSTIQSSHSVPFNFNSHPSNFHPQVSQSFPHNWSPPSGGGHPSGGGSNWSGGSHGGGGHSGGWSGSGGWNGHRSWH